MRSPTRLHVCHHFALKPSKVGVHRQHDEQQQNDFDERDDQLGVGVKEVDHGWAFASGTDLIMVQKRPSVPLENRLSFAGKIAPAGTSYGAWPFLENSTRVASAVPSNSPAGSTLYPATCLRISSNTAAGDL